MDNKEALVQEIRKLLQSQKLAVLATNNQGQPYTSLVAFAATDDLQEIYFATSRTTRKYANLTDDSRVSMLIDSRSNQVSDFHQAVAATIIGQASEPEQSERDSLVRLYLNKHPHLQDFLSSPNSAMLRIRVKTFYLVSKFQKVMELHLQP